MGSAKRPSEPPLGGPSGDPADAPANRAAAELVSPAGPTPPQAVLELAAACVRFVAASVTIEPDFSRETLPLVDHYLAQARAAVRQRPETLPLITHAVGAYLGEVVRRIHPSWWHLEGDDPSEWRLQFRDVYLSFAPMQVVALVLSRPEGDEEDDGDEGAGLAEGGPGPPAETLEPVPEPGLQLAPEDHEAVRRRLDDLPPVSDDDYYSLSTRLEVIDIAVDAVLTNLLAEPERRRAFRPEDYS